MNSIRRITKRAVIISLLATIFFLIPVVNAKASEQHMSVVETYTGDENIVAFVRGAGENSDVLVNIGTDECKGVRVSKVAGNKDAIKTLVLIDNSKSFEKYNKQIQDILQDVIANFESEQIAIATFDETIKYETDYTHDYEALKNAIKQIEYSNKDTYLADVLYDWIKNEYANRDDDAFCRIIVISDGADNKSTGKSVNQVYDLLKEYKVPVYTIGCSTSKNTDKLKEMFSFADVTDAAAFDISTIQNLTDISAVLKQDRDIVRLDIKPDAKLLDGSLKSVQIVIGGQKVSVDIKMPQKTYVEPTQVVEEKVTPTEEVKKKKEKETKTEPESQDFGPLLVIIIIAVAVLIIAVVVIVIVLGAKKKSKEDVFSSYPDDFGMDDTGKTEILTPYDYGTWDSETESIWGSTMEYNVVLTDVNSPSKSFQMPLTSMMIVGKNGDIVIDYDKSVSKNHCQISVRDRRFYVRDLGATNGTFLNGSRVLDETEIVSGNVLTLGRVQLRFEVR